MANDLTVGGTDLFVDTSAEKLGIGTATANQLHQKLNIYSSSEAGIQFMNDATGVANSTDGARVSVYEDDIQYTNYESAGKQIFNVGTNGATTAMTIDSSGYVTKPQQPAFIVTNATGASAFSGNSIATWNNQVHNNGGHFKMDAGTGQYQRFIAPVAAYYFFSVQMISNVNTNMFFNLRKNGSNILGTSTESYMSSGHASASSHATVYLSASDYVEVYMTASTASYGGNYANFNGFLIG